MLKKDYVKAYLPDSFDFQIPEDLKPDWFLRLEAIGDDTEKLKKHFPQEWKIFLHSGKDISFYDYLNCDTIVQDELYDNKTYSQYCQFEYAKQIQSYLDSLTQVQRAMIKSFYFLEHNSYLGKIAIAVKVSDVNFDANTLGLFFP
jgi:hypothetical protein